MLMEVEEIRYKLKDRKASAVSLATGINATTICMIRNGTNQNPNSNTLKKLTEYFRENK